MRYYDCRQCGITASTAYCDACAANRARILKRFVAGELDATVAELGERLGVTARQAYRYLRAFKRTTPNA